jgi:sterol desaturase/sphingolipid hydroxylase (fatty acid hydroxylase superfamily)
MATGILGTQLHHCGYRPKWMPDFDDNPNFHDFHHETFIGNFGMIGLCDWLHKTDLKWRRVRHARRQR